MRNEQNGARAAALYALGRCRRFDAWSAQTLPGAAEKFHLDTRDSALCARLCLSVLQNAALMDYYIDCYSSVPASKLEPQIRDVLRLGVCQLLFMDRIPVNAAVSESVNLAKTISSKASGLVNAVLRRIAENKTQLPEIPDHGTARELSIARSHPLWLCEKMIGEHGYDFADAFFRANNTEPGLTITVNTCKISRDDYGELLKAQGISFHSASRSPVSIHLPQGGNVAALPGYSEGLFFVQDEAAAIAAGCSAVKPGMRVLDGCSAPGGKSLLSAVYMKNQGEIISCDIHGKKLRLIDENASRLGLDIIRTVPMDGAAPYDNFREAFDLVIADVPCSGLGVIRKKPEIRYKDPDELQKLPQVQQRILQGLSSCVRPGGILLYSTCTILHEENEAVTDAFLAKHSDFTREEQHTLWPNIDGTDGFYICRMKRNG